MSRKLTVGSIQNTAGTTAIVMNNVSLTGRYIRQIYSQVDTVGRSTTTGWLLGPEYPEVEGFLPGSVIRVDYHIPGRNDSTSWGGMYPEIQVKFNNNSWLSVGGPGYDVVMNLGYAFINSYHNTVFIDPVQIEDFSTQFRFYFRSFDGTVLWNTSHDINNVSGTASIMSGNNGLQHYAHIIVQELALLA
jgi:hypothetical protein